MHDWGKVFAVENAFCEIAPADEKNTAEILRAAAEQKIRVRIRGRGHSMNGSSLPRRDELLLLTDQIRHYQWKSPAEISVGAGMSVYALQEWLKARGFSLPIFNDGILGPSVGGYISAAGIGTRSVEHGGFWENVRYIKLIDATGKLHRLEPKHPDFAWLFGSMGQFGLIYEVGLKIIPGKNPQFASSSGSIPEAWLTGPDAAARLKEYEESRLTWFTVIAPLEKKAELLADLLALKEAHRNSLNYIPEYIWPVKKRTFTPPLFYPEHRDLICIGIWGYGNPVKKDVSEGILRLSEAVMELLGKKPFYRRYIQAEPARAGTDWKAYFGEKIFREFSRIRAVYNPLGNLNENCIFGCTGPQSADTLSGK